MKAAQDIETSSPLLPVTEHNLPGHCPLNALVPPQIIVTHTAPHISKVALGKAATLSGEFLVYALDLSPGILSYSYPFHPTFTLTSSTCFPSILSHNEVKTKQRLSPPNTRSSSGEHTVSLLSQLTSTTAQSPTHWELSVALLHQRNWSCLDDMGIPPSWFLRGCWLSCVHLGFPGQTVS